MALTSPSSWGPLAGCWVCRDSPCGHSCPHQLCVTCLSGLHWHLRSGLLARHRGVSGPFPCLSPTLLCPSRQPRSKLAAGGRPLMLQGTEGASLGPRREQFPRGHGGECGPGCALSLTPTHPLSCLPLPPFWAPHLKTSGWLWLNLEGRNRQ